MISIKNKNFSNQTTIKQLTYKLIKQFKGHYFGKKGYQRLTCETLFNIHYKKQLVRN